MAVGHINRVAALTGLSCKKRSGHLLGQNKVVVLLR